MLRGLSSLATFRRGLELVIVWLTVPKGWLEGLTSPTLKRPLEIRRKDCIPTFSEASMVLGSGERHTNPIRGLSAPNAILPAVTRQRLHVVGTL